MKKIFSFFFLAILLWAWPTMASTHTVQSGDTLGEIAKAAGIPVRELARLNGIKNINKLQVGQRIIISGKKLRLKSRDATKTDTSKADVWRWRSPGGKPYLKGKDWTDLKRFGKKLDKAFQIFRYPSVVEKTLRDQIWKDFYAKFSLPENKFEIANGYTAEVMMDGSGYHKNVLADFKKPNTRVVAKRYQAEFEGSVYMVDIPLSCGNESKNIAIIKKEIIPTIPSKKKMPKVTQAFCEDCDDEMETDIGVYGGIHAPGSQGQTLSVGSFGEVLYPWRSLADDCSSEYWWAPGLYGSLYAYKASHSSSNGWGFRTTGDFGVRRNWLSDKELLRQWVFKFRPGIEYSHWGGDGNNHINQIGPTFGLHGEYRHELIEGRLQAWASAEVWFGLGDQDVSSNFSGIQPASRLFTNFSVGLDYQLAPRWVLRGYAGIDYEGWSGEIPFVPGIELRHELFDRKGTISVGLQAKIYAALDPTAIAYAKYENNTVVPRWYEKKRQSSVKLVGKGIGGNQYRESSVKIDVAKANTSTIAPVTSPPNQANTSFTNFHNDSSPSPAFDFSGPNRPHGDA